MTEPKLKSETISEATKTHLIDLFVSMKYGRNTDISNRYTIKGNMVEEDSLTLYSRFKGDLFRKNNERFTNEFISGTPDIILNDDVRDIKSSWDIYTFFRYSDKLIKQYYWQILGYMALTDKSNGTVAYCLIDTPDILINDEKRRLMYKMGVVDEYANKDFEAACKEIDLQMTYSDIPIEERIVELHVKRNDDDIGRLYERIKQCRDYMNKKFFKITA